MVIPTHIKEKSRNKMTIFFKEHRAILKKIHPKLPIFSKKETVPIPPESWTKQFLLAVYKFSKDPQTGSWQNFVQLCIDNKYTELVSKMDQTKVLCVVTKEKVKKSYLPQEVKVLIEHTVSLAMKNRLGLSDILLVLDRLKVTTNNENYKKYSEDLIHIYQTQNSARAGKIKASKPFLLAEVESIQNRRTSPRTSGFHHSYLPGTLGDHKFMPSNRSNGEQVGNEEVVRESGSEDAPLPRDSSVRKRADAVISSRISEASSESEKSFARTRDAFNRLRTSSGHASWTTLEADFGRIYSRSVDPFHQRVPDTRIVEGGDVLHVSEDAEGKRIGKMVSELKKLSVDPGVESAVRETPNVEPYSSGLSGSIEGSWA